MNNFYIPTPQPDLDEDGLPTEKRHDCLDFLKLGENDLYRCLHCGDQFTDDEVERMYHPELPARKQPQYEPMQASLFSQKEVA